MPSYLEEPKGHVLVVDDEVDVLRAHERALTVAGYVVQTATDGAEALEALTLGEIDAVVSDIAMPKMDGITLLQHVRARDLDLPVILITGAPSIQSAMDAVRHGAHRYLTKPVSPKELAREVQHAVKLYEWAKLRRSTSDSDDEALRAGDRAGISASFNRALASMWMAYQPIVEWSKRSIFGYEALMRLVEPALPLPGAVLRAAERLDRCEDVGRVVRKLVSTDIGSADPSMTIFINLHVRDLLDDQLFDPTAALTHHARRLVLEITERAALDEVKDVYSRVQQLRERGFRVAIDDLGAGYSSLTSLAQLRPDMVKLDMSLVRNVHRDRLKERLVKSFLEIGREMGILVIAEGVETVEERECLVAAGCELLQGYLFARPAKGFHPVAF
jgi:EAL domain-containing protein (putative c-di-GMP-specific phosphodiesterase class I)/CheY-like chemotaxis protein